MQSGHLTPIHTSPWNWEQWPLRTPPVAEMETKALLNISLHRLFFFFFFFVFLEPHLQHVEVPRLGVESEL